MEKHRVLLICRLTLFCEGLRRIFGQQEDVQLVCLSCADPRLIESYLHDFSPETVVIAGQSADDADAQLISKVLNHWPEIPVVWIELETNMMRIYTSRTLPANSRDLIDTIRRASLGSDEDGSRLNTQRRR